jgi:hypothetical protein
VLSRIDQAFLTSRTCRGERFNEPVTLVSGATRTYELMQSRPVGSTWHDKVIAAIGVLLLVLGVIGIVLEKKLSRYQ